MTEFKGTKGKWSIGEQDQYGIQIWCNQSHYVARAYHGGSDRTDDETNANAQLIATAPELLSELQHAVKALEAVSSFGATRPIIESAKRIISKALGKED